MLILRHLLILRERERERDVIVESYDMSIYPCAHEHQHDACEESEMSYEPRCVRNCEDAERYHLVTWSKHAVASMQHASPQAHATPPPHTATRRLGVTHISHSLTRCLWSSLVSVVSQAVYSQLSGAARGRAARHPRSALTGPTHRSPHTHAHRHAAVHGTGHRRHRRPVCAGCNTPLGARGTRTREPGPGDTNAHNSQLSTNRWILH